MLGQKLLKRLTRLGLSAYLMTWCMSFTVCASDYPISDIVTSDSEILMSSIEDNSTAEDGLNITTTSPGENVENIDSLTDIPAVDNMTSSDELFGDGNSSTDISGEEPGIAPVDGGNTDIEPAPEPGGGNETGDATGNISLKNGTFPTTSNGTGVVGIKNISISPSEYVAEGKMNITLSILINPLDATYDANKLVLGVTDTSHANVSWTQYVVSVKKSSESDRCIEVEVKNYTKDVSFYITATYINSENAKDNPHAECLMHYIAPKVDSISLNADELVSKDAKNVTVSVTPHTILGYDGYNSSKLGISIIDKDYIEGNLTGDYSSTGYYTFARTNEDGETYPEKVDFTRNGDSFNIYYYPYDARVRTEEFYLRVFYDNGADDPADFPSAICKLRYESSYVPVESFSLNAHELVVTNKSDIVLLGVESVIPDNAAVNINNYTLTILGCDFTDVGNGYEEAELLQGNVTWRRDTSAQAFALNLSNLSESVVFFAQVTHDASGYSDICRIQYVAPSDESNISVTFPQSSMNLELFKKENLLPVTIHADFEDYDDLMGAGDTDLTEESDYIVDAWFTNGLLESYFNIYVVDGDMLNIRLRDSVIEHNTTAEINRIIKNKYTSDISFLIRCSNSNRTISSQGTVTFNVKRSVPSVKAKTLVFNPYLFGVEQTGYDTFEPVFTGAEVESFRFNSNKTVPVGYTELYGKLIRATGSVNEKTKSGKIPVLAKVDTNVWNLPGDNEIAVDIPYSLKNAVPKLKVNGAAKGSLNPIYVGHTNFSYTIANDPAAGLADMTDVKISILDSKNKNASGYFNYLLLEYETSIISIKLKNPNDNSTFGKSYKVLVTPYNTANGKSGVTTTFTLTVKKLADAGKITLSATTKGDINALDCNSFTTVTVKSNEPFGRAPTVSVTSENGSDITEAFDFFDKLALISNDRKTIQFSISEYVDDGNYTLLRNGLDGKKVKVNISYTFTGNPSKTLSVIKTITIKRGAVTPKLSATKAVVNPAWDNLSRFSFYYNLSSVGYRYPVNITVYSGKNVLESRIWPTGYSGLGTYSCNLSQVLGDQSQYYGKTLDFKVTPVLMNGTAGNYEEIIPGRKISEFKTSTLKLTILNPYKSNPKITASVKGSIDSIKNLTYNNIYNIANVTLKVSNIYEAKNLVSDVRIYNSADKNKTPIYDPFAIRSVPNYNGNQLEFIIYHNATRGDLPSGTYKADFITDYGNVTCSFKVTKSKVNPVFDKKNMELYNNNTKRDIFAVHEKNSALNNVSSITIADKNTIFDVKPVGNGRFSIGFADVRYVEKKSGKAITSPVTKTVKLNVYHEGSTVPQVVSVKVKIYP